MRGAPIAAPGAVRTPAIVDPISDELRELRDELGARLLEDLENRTHAELRYPDIGKDFDDVVELRVRKGHELVLREPVPVQVVLELRAPLGIVRHEGRLAEVTGLPAGPQDLAEHHTGEHAVPDPAAPDRVDHPRRIADEGNPVPDGFLDRRGRRPAA